MASLRILWAGFGAVLFLPLVGQAQQVDLFQGQAVAYQGRLTRYFASPEAERVARQTLLDSVRTFGQDTIWARPGLRTHLDQYEHLLVSVRRHYLYRRLSALRDREDTGARTDMRGLNTASADLSTTLSRGVASLDPATLTPARLAVDGIGRYAYLVELVRAATTATGLSPTARRAVADITDPLRETLTARYDHLLDQLPPPVVPPPSAAASAADAAAHRSQQAQAKLQAYTAHADVLAATLLDLTQLGHRLARQAGAVSAPDQVYRRRLQVGEPAVRDLLAEVARHPQALHHYQQVQQARVRTATGLATVHSWDLAAAQAYTPPPRSLATARPLLLAALRPLGPFYGQQLARLLDPANGMLDLTGGAHRTTENTALGFVQAPTTLYMKGFDGSPRSLSVLLHEGGHAVHRDLMSQQGIVPSYGGGPSFLFEAFALFNEMLLLDELQRTSRSPAERHYYESLFCEKLAHEVYTSAQEGAFEQGLYEGVAAGKLTTRAQVDSLYASILAPSDLFFPTEPGRRSEWVGKRLLFDDPLYNVTYLYAMLVAAKLYQQVHARPRWFAPRYLALLQHGFDAPAGELLQRYLGFGLDHQALLADTEHLLETQVAHLTQ